MFNEHSYVYIEDDPLSRQIMRTIFERIMKVEHSLILETSENFLENIQAMTPLPDVILLDIHIKPHSGFDMLQILRANPAFQQAKIVALTASVMSEEVEELRLAGFDSTIGKPLNVRTFPDLVAQVLQGQHVWHVG